MGDSSSGLESQRQEQAQRDADFHHLYDEMRQGRSEREWAENTQPGVPFYSWDASKSSSASAGFAACELFARKINQPGKIQPSGLLLCVNVSTGLVQACSRNCQRFLHLDEDAVLGKLLTTFFKDPPSELSELKELGPRPHCTHLTLLKREVQVEVTVSRAEGWVLLDLEEQAEKQDSELAKSAADVAQSATGLCVTLKELHRWMVNEIQRVSGFDRVKIYKFHPDQHGEVVGEALKGKTLESCLYLHYPATDVPQRARDLFLMNEIRFVEDAKAEQVALVCLPDSAFDANSIPLSSCCLRAVHPCHLEYLQNMNVASSLTLAIIVKHKLWGLVACHHGRPRKLSREARNCCWRIGQAYNARLAELLQQQLQQRHVDIDSAKRTIREHLRPDDGRNVTLNKIQYSLAVFQDVVGSEGFAFVHSDGIKAHGKTPSSDCIRELDAVLHSCTTPGRLSSSSVLKLLDSSLNANREMLGNVVGVLAVRCVRGCTLMWFRQEFIREVKWAGSDRAPYGPGRFGARQSFDHWAESVRDECRPWTEDEDTAVEMAITVDRCWFEDTSIERLATDKHGEVLQWNEALSKLVCMSASKAVGQRLSDLCYHCDQDAVQDMLARFRTDKAPEGKWTAQLNIYTQKTEGGRGFEVHRRFNAQSKELFVFESLDAAETPPLPTESGAVDEPMESPLAASPLTEFHVPQDVLVFEEVRSPVWIMDCSPDCTTFLWANQAALATLGCTLTEFQCLDLKPDFMDANAKRLWHRKVQEQGRSVQSQQSFFRPSATVLDVHVSPIAVKTAGGGKVHALVLGRPSLHEEKSAWRSVEMLQATKVSLLLFSIDGELLSANVSARVYYSLSTARADITLADVFDSCEWESAAQRADSFDAMMAACTGEAGANAPRLFEMERVKRHRRQGVVHHMQFSAARDPATGGVAIAVTETDISQLKSVQEELVASQQQQERFLAATSHELRTPLHAILALSDSLIQDKTSSLPESCVRVLKIIQSSGQQLASLVNDILDAAAIRAGALVLKNDMVQLHDVAESVVDLISPMAPQSVRVVNAVPYTFPVLQMDGTRLSQILTNLLGNAVKFTRQGEIRISAEIQGEGSRVAVTVSDTGRGIPEQKLQAVWEAFQQLDPNVSGSGLGLTIVQSIVEAMGGVITVKSSTNSALHGTSFTFVLPSSPETHARRLLTEKPERGGAASSAEGGTAKFNYKSVSSWKGMLAALDPGARSPTEGATFDLQTELAEVLAKLQARELELEAIKGERDRRGESEPEPPLQPASDTPSRSAAVLPAPQALWRPEGPWRADGGRMCVVVCEDGIEGSDLRVLELLGLAPSACTPAQALTIPAAPRDQRERLELVLVNGRQLAGGEVEGSQIARKLQDLSVPVLLLDTDPSDLQAALAAGYSGVARLPLALDELHDVLKQQRDLLRLWQWRSVLHANTRPLESCPCDRVAARAAALLEGAGVQRHPQLAVAWITIEVFGADSDRVAAPKADNALAQLLKSCYDAVCEEAERHGAMVSEAAASYFSLVAGLDASESDAATATACNAAFKAATACLRTLQELVVAREGFRLRVRARGGLSVGEVLEAVSGELHAPRSDQLPSSLRLAFVGAPCTRAALLAASCQPGQLAVDQAAVAALVPEAAANPAPSYTYALERGSWTVGESNTMGIPDVGVEPPRTEDASCRDEACFQDFVEQLERRARQREAAAGSIGGVATTQEELLQLATLASAKLQALGEHLLIRLDTGHGRRMPLQRRNSRSTCSDVALQGDELLSMASIASCDDNPVNQVVMESILRPRVKAMRTFMDGPDALDALLETSDPPDVLLLDVMLPTINGLDVCRTLRERFSPTQLPIVLVSGRSSKDSVIEGLDAGANDYIIKPFDSGELISRITAQLKYKAVVRMEIHNARRDELHRSTLPPPLVERFVHGAVDDLFEEELQAGSVLCVGVEDCVALTTGDLDRAQRGIRALAALFVAFDRLCDQSGAWRVESEGDKYLVVAGQSGSDSGPRRLVSMGLEMVRLSRSIPHPTKGGTVQVRIAIHTGRVISSVLGLQKPRLLPRPENAPRDCAGLSVSNRIHVTAFSCGYYVCGEAVEVARSMERSATPMSVTVSAASRELLGEQFACLPLGPDAAHADAASAFVVQDKSSEWEAAVAASQDAPAQPREPPAHPPFDALDRHRASSPDTPGMRSLSLSESASGASDTQSTASVRGAMVAHQEESGQAARSGQQVDVAAVEAQPDAGNGLALVLQKAKLPHLVAELQSQGVDVDFLAHADDAELNKLEVPLSVSERSRVRRCAKAWVTLFG